MQDSNIMYFFYYGFAAVVLAFLVWLDADHHFSSGAVWGVLMLCCWPVVLPVYLVMRLRSARGMSEREREQRSAERERWARGSGDIYTLHYRKAAAEGPGTLYQPPDAGLRRGYRHFADQRAEALLLTGQHQPAWEYLSELYLLAVQEGDVPRHETYCYYINQLPGGRAKLDELLAAGPAADSAAPPFSAPPAAGSVAGRQAPF